MTIIIPMETSLSMEDAGWPPFPYLAVAKDVAGFMM